jgi:asparagine synthase (glutamine-hydrolysing)
MPGVFGVADPSADTNQLTSIAEYMCELSNVRRASQEFVENTHISEPFLLGHHSIRRFISQKGIAQSGSMVMVLDGILFGSFSQLNVAQVLSRYQQEGVELVKKLRGNFTVAICNSRTGDLYLYTDHASTRPIYYTIQDDKFYFASDYSILSTAIRDSEETSPQAWADMLTFGYLIGCKTPKESIHRMPAGSCLHWNAYKAHIEIQPYFVADNTPMDSVSYTELRDELQALFIQAVERTLLSARHLFTLSGGLDSRAILGTAQQLGIKYPDCLTFGEPASLDIKTALRVAHKSQAQVVLVTLGQGNYLTETLPEASHYNGGMVYYNGSAHFLYALQKINVNRWDIVHTGMSGDMLMGSFLHKADIHKLGDNLQSISELILTRFGRLSWIDFFAKDKSAARRLIQNSVRDSLRVPSSNATISQVLELWNLHNRQQRAMFNGFRMVENFAEYTSPFFDADLYQYVLRIPHRHRLGEDIYIDMLSNLLPSDIWEIPWQKTGHRPSTSRWINKLNAWSTLYLGRAAQYIFPQVARSRSMNPTRIWLRENIELQEFTSSRLLDWDLTSSLLDRNKINEFALNIADGNIGVNRRIPALLFRLLTLSTW